MAEAKESGLILVTGASGFLASHVVKQLQASGHQVRGTVRSLENEAKVKPLYELCPDAEYKLQLVEADLLNEESWVPAVDGCTFVIHVASPFPAQNPEHEDELIRPAVDGTLNVLKACKKAGTVKRVVLTSSIVAVSGGFGSGHGVDNPFTENDWTNTESSGTSAYTKSKTSAEKAAWNFVKGLPDDECFELAVINPGYMCGPTLIGRDATSFVLHKKLLERAMPVVPRICFATVDVRDVAAAHIKAMVSPEAAGNRHILTTGNLWIKDFAHILDKEFRPYGYNVPTREAPYFMMYIAGFFDKSVKMLLSSIGKCSEYDNSRMKSVLGISPVALQDTVIEMAHSMIEAGLINRSTKYVSRTKPDSA